MQVLVGLGEELVNHLAVFANIASGGITLIKEFIALHTFKVFDDILPTGQIEPFFLLIDKLQSPLTLYVVECYSGKIMSVVTVGPLANLVDGILCLVSSAKKYQCLSLIEQHLSVAQFHTVQVVQLIALARPLRPTVNKLAIAGQGNRGLEESNAIARSVVELIDVTDITTLVGLVPGCEEGVLSR